ncbi:hypothetical protein SLNWT_4744 [Streptomyces albus]|uniref:Uncharacterized protein n=1 Tax=Streptomyces albus (strain ATCC 21838 / DSM 41398 / FERM P-419 / JCM 4703 / NBRC 107858) TaxID=1081613 RepID=A0A0B5F0J2_STRA4|nr:hypothetical protein SLNWT_4744 [Streptomyces albus]AOU79427.1 hypothetical protein SLNHY_4736 [Streptomyces albus]AYN35153.1 hypothetical protein DUI70_4655 [Streptomyces albus]
MVKVAEEFGARPRSPVRAAAVSVPSPESGTDTACGCPGRTGGRREIPGGCPHRGRGGGWWRCPVLPADQDSSTGRRRSRKARALWHGSDHSATVCAPRNDVRVRRRLGGAAGGPLPEGGDSRPNRSGRRGVPPVVM